MATDIRSLFKIVGEEGPALKRVEEAMEWLLSPKAEGIGQKLLRDAHAVHNIPVTIIATELEQSGYYAELGHIVKINPKCNASTFIKAPDGTSHAISVERSLAHELAHAGDPKATAQVAHALEATMERAAQAGMARFSADEIAVHNHHLINAQNAQDYDTAKQHIADWVDRVALPQQEEVLRHLHNDPEFERYIAEMEPPAVAAENKVAALRGEPLRTDYRTSHHAPPEAIREMLIDEVSNELKIHEKPRSEAKAAQRADGKRWAEALGDRNGRQLGT